jgi:hypothetical protein
LGGDPHQSRYQRQETKMKYQTIWISTRGFANEGVYAFGAEADVQRTWYAYRDNNNDARYSVQSTHRTLDAARRSAEKLVQLEKNSARRNAYQCTISTLDAAEYVSYLGPDDPVRAGLRMAL